MRTSFFFCLFILLSSLLNAQVTTPIQERIQHTRSLFKTYEKLQPVFYQRQVLIDELPLSKKEKRELKSWRDSEYFYESNHPDSISPGAAIVYLSDIIAEQLDKIVRDPKFFEHDVLDEINIDDLDIVVSEDRRLVSFSFDEKIGGTYRSRISKLYLFHHDSDEITDISDEKFVWSDGYKKIFQLDTEGGRKYLLTGFVRSCNLCFTSFVQLINTDLEEEFLYSVTNRDWNDGVKYNPDTKTIHVRYQTDDLTRYCYCDDEKKYAELDNPQICTCKFTFNGKGFE